jgi:hypothetical protein
MATKRSGKAANRRSRQRPPRRPVIPQPAPRPDQADAAKADAVETPRRTAATREAEKPAPPRPIAPIYAGASRLNERAVAEYHYVGRDLRNIAVLTFVIVVVLVIASLALPALGIVSR